MNTDWVSSLPLGIAAEFIGGLASNLVAGLLRAVGSRTAKHFQQEQHKALEETLALALARALSEVNITEEFRAHYQDIFNEFFGRAAVQEELAILLDPRPNQSPDFAVLQSEFETAGYDSSLLPGLDFHRFITTLLESFQNAAIVRPEFQHIIELGYMRRIVEVIETLGPSVDRIANATESTAEGVKALESKVGAQPSLSIPHLVLKLYQLDGPTRSPQEQVMFERNERMYRQQFRFGVALVNLNENSVAHGIDIELEIHWRGNEIQDSPKFSRLNGAEGWTVHVSRITAEQPAVFRFRGSDRDRCPFGQPLRWETFGLLLEGHMEGYLLAKYRVSSASPSTQCEGELRINIVSSQR